MTLRSGAQFHSGPHVHFRAHLCPPRNNGTNSKFSNDTDGASTSLCSKVYLSDTCIIGFYFRANNCCVGVFCGVFLWQFMLQFETLIEWVERFPNAWAKCYCHISFVMDCVWQHFPETVEAWTAIYGEMWLTTIGFYVL